MIISLLTDPLIMTNSNYAEGYNVLIGEVDMNNPCNSKYGKVHTGTANYTCCVYCVWRQAHTDLHGRLSLTPIIFTLTLFNQLACNNTRFWRPLDYIPNLSHAKGAADRQLTKDKIQDEHTCISCIFAVALQNFE